MSSKNSFDDSAPAALPVFYRTYSRMVEAKAVRMGQVTERTIAGTN